MFKLPITHIMLSPCTDAKFTVTPLASRGGVKVGLVYQLVAINGKGQVALKLDGTDEQVEDKGGNMWHALDNLAWALDKQHKPIETLAANDNG